VSYEIVYSRQAQKDAKKLAKSNLKAQAEELLTILKEDPFRSPPRWEASGRSEGLLLTQDQYSASFGL